MLHMDCVLRKRWNLAVCLMLVIGIAAGVPCFAQSGGGTLTGTIHDASGAAVANVPVSLSEVSTQAAYKTVTSAEGIYSFRELPAGVYSIAVSATGFKSFTQKGINVSVANTSVADIALQVGRAEELVEVHADAQQVESETTDVSTTVPQQLIQDLPLAFGGLVRSPLTFVTLTPGFNGSVAGSPGLQGGFKLGGGQVGGAETLLDGSSLDFASPNLQENYGVGMDAVEEFKVMTNTFDAAYGRSSGGLVNLVTKSGTNQIHGAVFELLKNKVLDANSWDNNHRGISRGLDTQNDFGFVVSGPVLIPKLYNGKNKTFWLFNYEGFRFNTGGTGIATAPLAAELNGDFSALLKPYTAPSGTTYVAHQLYDYATCTGANLGQPCAPFHNNQIPVSRLDPLSKNVLQYLPHPDADKANQPYENATQNSVSHHPTDTYTVKLDQNFGSKHKIAASYDYENVPQSGTNSLGPLYANGGSGQLTHYARLSWDYTITPTVLNHLSLGYTRRFRTEGALSTIGNNWPDKLGLKGVMQTQFPSFNICYTTASPNCDTGSFQTPPTGDGSFADNSYQYNDSVSWMRGKHSYSAGVEYRDQRFIVRYLTYTSGAFTYTSGPTSALSTQNDPNSGFGLASFFLGAASPDLNTQIGSPQQDGIYVHYWGFYFKDDWKVSPKLTANLGLRYELPMPAFEAKSRTSHVDFTVPNPGADGLPGAMVFDGTGTGRDGRKSPQDMFTKSFGPRLGLAYAVNPATVVRVGYGIYFTNLKINNFANEDSAGFAGTGYKWTQSVSPQTPAVIPSQITSFPGVLPPFINPTLENGFSGATVILSKEARPGTTQNWTLDIQRQLPSNILLDVAYVGMHADHLQSYQKDPNQGLPVNMARGQCLEVLITAQATNPACAGQTRVPIPYTNFLKDFGANATVSQALRPYPQFGTVSVDTAFSGNPFGVSTYHALQVQVRKTLSNDLTLLANYTWSKNLTNADADYPAQANWTSGQGALNVYNPKAEKGLSIYDRPQVVNVAFSYDLPFGKNKMTAPNKVLNAVIAKWQLAGQLTYSSGSPDLVTESNWDSGIFAGNATGDGGIQARPNLVQGVSVKGSHSGEFKENDPGSRNANPAAFSYAPSFTFGDAKSHPGIRELFGRNENLSASKRIPLGMERLNMVFRVEAFDVFNRHTFGCFNNNISNPNFGEAGCANGNRTMQGNLRINF